MEMAPAIGIDLGTTNTVAGVWLNGHVKLIPNNDAQGTNLFPSCVAFKNNERYIGTPAKDQAIGNPHNTIYSIKRLMGRRFSDEKVRTNLKWPFKVVSTDDNRPKVSVQYQQKDMLFHPQQISSMVLTKVKEMADKFLQCKIKDAVITVPAYFDELQRNATIDAGRIAGLNVLHIMDEPTAAAVAYGFETTKTTSKEKNLLVFDLGGGTFDVSIVTMKGSLYNVKAITGDTNLGGDDFDGKLMDYLINEIKMEFDKDITGNAKHMNRLRESCEKTKKTLSSQKMVEIDLNYIGIDDSISISQASYEYLIEDHLKECIKLVANCLKDAKMDKSDIDDILLIGGSTRIPMVKKLLADFFENKELCQGINPDEAVAHGAAIMAASLSGNGGKSVQELKVTGITPLSFGTDVVGGLMSIIIKKNTPIPAKMEKPYFTVQDNQKSVHVGVYQGENALLKDNLCLGDFVLSGIPPAPSGVPKIIVCFQIDVNGVLKVTAKDVIGGNEEQITVTNEEGGLSRKEIEEIIQEAEESRRLDEEIDKRDEARNSLLKYAYKMRKEFEEKSSYIKQYSSVVVIKVIDETINWVTMNENLDASKFLNKFKELQATLKDEEEKVEKMIKEYEARKYLTEYAYRMRKEIEIRSNYSMHISYAVANKAIDDVINWVTENAHLDVTELSYKYEELRAILVVQLDEEMGKDRKENIIEVDESEWMGKKEATLEQFGEQMGKKEIPTGQFGEEKHMQKRGNGMIENLDESDLERFDQISIEQSGGERIVTKATTSISKWLWGQQKETKETLVTERMIQGELMGKRE